MSSADDSDKEVKTTRRRHKRDPSDGQYRPQVDSKIPKKPKPIGAPPRPKSAYTLYMAAKYKEYKEENPEMKTKEIWKEMAAAWKEEDAESKKEFVDAAAEEKSEYEEKNKKYRASAKFKRFKRDLKEWNELYRDEYEEEQYEKAQKKKEAKNKPKAAKKAATPKKRGRKKKST
mmetsp:Transcript_186/g.271  ORF Transcript_186/g.271 Transcript_186/m.271 type:complete len:174 (-) Transcript_186:323-844(-)